MREIRFRGKRVDNGEWVEGYYFKRYRRSNGGVYHYISTGDIEYSCGTFPVDPATVGQYVGLHDSKRTAEYPEGQEIYEGDVVEQRLLPTKRIIYKFAALWSQEKAAFVIDGGTPYERRHLLSDYCQNPPYEVEVIGNIRDNPELIKG